MTLPSSGNAPQPTDSADARAYNRQRRIIEVADAVIGFAVLLLLVVMPWSAELRDVAWKLARENYPLALFLYVIALATLAKLAGISLDYYGFRLEHRYHLSNQSFGSWLIDEAKGWLLGIVIGGLVAELIYFIIRQAPQLWWLIAWAAFIVLFIFFAQVAPVVLFPLFYKFVPLENEELKQRLVRLGEKAGAKVRGVYEWKLSEKSKKANAALTGLGNTRRIILSDTLLAGYTHDEIEAVLAHELGHHVHQHIMKSIAVQVAITLVGFWAASQVLAYAVNTLHMYPEIYDFANLPLLALVSSVLSLLLLPALNAYSRYNEWQADHYCWKAVPSVQPFISAMNKLSDQNLAERNPSRLVEVLFHSHPPISKRIAAAERFANR
ncbi:MAG TPA: M48 family metallopeptidase [Terriglobales bacterium]|nr:M48 family metallopeptidase [Terriglobales bacterium]